MKQKPGWWFQPLWKILVKIGSFPQVGVKIKNIWNHHPETDCLGYAGDEILHSCGPGIQKKGSLLTIKQPVQWNSNGKYELFFFSRLI